MDGNDVREIFRANLRRLRARKGLSQLALATELGMAHNFINAIEQGKKWVSPDTIAKLAVVLDAEPYQFFISAEPASEEERAFAVACFDELSDSVTKAIAEVRGRYLKD